MDITKVDFTDRKHPSGSPSTEAHTIALRRFVEARNGKLR